MDNEEIVEIVPAVGSVQSLKDILSIKESTAQIQTPEGMDLVGWALDGWVSMFPFLDEKARPVYAFKEGEV